MNPVVFVGAGPGDPELITLKGHRHLQSADVVIYAGSLVNPQLLSFCKASAQIHDSASMNLEEILAVMEQGVLQGKKVVRLQTGDFSLYGSVREQIEGLDQRNLCYELVPGVSSFLGAASMIGAEYTVPEISQSLVITRMAGRTPVPSRESLRSFAAHQTSMAIFLSVQGIGAVTAELLEGGYAPDTPCCVIYKATWPEQIVVKGTLADIERKVHAAGIQKTALILVGEFLGSAYHHSKLYDKEFSHEYRAGRADGSGADPSAGPARVF